MNTVAAFIHFGGIGLGIATGWLLLAHAADVVGNRIWPSAPRQGGGL